MVSYDHVILTAANEAQARGYRAQIAWRNAQGLLDRGTEFHVIADPGGYRVGSLGATLNVLLEMARGMSEPSAASIADLFSNQRILICHSGGDSRRLPEYAGQGKVFAPLPTQDAHDANTLFDLLLKNLEQIPSPPNGHVLIAAGDVLLTFDPQIVDLDRAGIVGVAYPGPTSRGSQHGVYVTESNPTDAGPVPVVNFLQKPDEATARQHGAVDSVGRVLVDTGLISLDADTVDRLLSVSGVSLSRTGSVRVKSGLMQDILRGTVPPMDLYEEFTFAAAPRISADDYVNAIASRLPNQSHRSKMNAFREAIHQVPFSVVVLPYAEFFHIGSSREMLLNVSTLSRTSREYGFANLCHSYVSPGSTLEGAFVYNAFIDSSKVRASSGSLMEAVHVDAGIELQGNNLLVGLPATGRRSIRLRPNIALSCMPIDDAWTAVIHGIDDDFKGRHDEHGECLFLNQSIAAWLDTHQVRNSDIWDAGDAKHLWSAKMWVVGPINDTLRHTLWMQSAKRDRKQRDAWLSQPRYSMSELLTRVNHERLIGHRRDIQRRV